MLLSQTLIIIFCQGTPPYDVFKGQTNLDLQKLILDTFDVQVAIVIVEEKLMVRVSAQVYNTMDDFIKLADAVMELTKAKSES